MSKEIGAANGSELEPVAITVPASSKKGVSKGFFKKTAKKPIVKPVVINSNGSDDALDNRELYVFLQM
jgi:hypothetical protein